MELQLSDRGIVEHLLACSANGCTDERLDALQLHVWLHHVVRCSCVQQHVLECCTFVLLRCCDR